VSDKDLVHLAMRLAQRTGTEPVEPNSIAEVAGQASDTPEPPQPSPIHPPPLPPAPASGALSPITTAKEKKTADELATMIVADLRGVKGCPKRGLKVAVYGSNPWNAWLSFGTDAGTVPNKAELQDFLEIITERLKRLYDVSS
jgi:hypothetical protein